MDIEARKIKILSLMKVAAEAGNDQIVQAGFIELESLKNRDPHDHTFKEMFNNAFDLMESYQTDEQSVKIVRQLKEKFNDDENRGEAC